MLRASHGRKFLEPFKDLWKGFKDSYFKVVAKPGCIPWFLETHMSGDVKERFPLYWSEEHHKLQAKDFLILVSDFTRAENEAVAFLGGLTTKDTLLKSSEFIFTFSEQQPDTSMVFFYC